MSIPFYLNYQWPIMLRHAIKALVFILLISLNAYAGEKWDDAQRIVGIWTLELAYGRDKSYHEYKFEDDGTFKYYKWHFNKNEVFLANAKTLKKKIEREGRYFIGADNHGNKLLKLKYLLSKNLSQVIIYKYKFRDKDTLEVSRHSRHYKEWKRKKAD